MIKAPSSLQDLRRRLYGMRKAEWAWLWAKSSVGRGGVVDGGSGHPDMRCRLQGGQRKRLRSNRSHKSCREVCRSA